MTQALALIFEVLLLARTRNVKPAAAYELYDLLQLVAVEPRAVTLADINDDA